MRSSIYLLLGNLAFSDLLFAIFAPFHISKLVENYNWQFGATFCKAFYFVFCSFYNFSIINLLLITVERFLATVYPLLFRSNSRRTFVLILAYWILSFIISTPYLVVMKHVSSGKSNLCFQNWPNKEGRLSYYTFIYISLYIVPFSLMAFMCASIFVTLRKQLSSGDANDTQQRQIKARKRMSLLVIVILVAFLICLSPWNIIEFIEQVHTAWKNPDVLPTVKPYAMLAAILSTTVNPILLSFVS